MDHPADLFSVKHTDAEYNSPMIGNGQIVTALGPTGYHNGFCPDLETANRTVFWAGRRFKDARSAKIRIPRVPPEELIGPTIPLVRFGRFSRTLFLNEVKTSDQQWQQTMEYGQGRVVSRLFHGAIEEETDSRICLGTNVLVFRTRLSNTSSEPVRVRFELCYEFGDADGQQGVGTRFNIRRPHPDDLEFGNVEGARSLDTDLSSRPPHVLESLSVQYEVESHLGEIHIGRYPNGVIQDTAAGGRFIHELTLTGSEKSELWFWASFSDRMHYTHFPPFAKLPRLLRQHDQAWAEFWQKSTVTLNDPVLDGIRRSCLYTLRCNASPWSIPPGYLSTTWEGRTFHDEFYPFMALLSSGHVDLAQRIPEYRLATLPHAQMRSGGKGACYGWEVTESGEESAPYGHWTDEQFRHGQISEQAWRYYLVTGDVISLERYYPVIRGCAEWMVHDALRRDERGRLTVRTMADIAEGVLASDNPIFAACATIRSLQNASAAAAILKKDLKPALRWRSLADELLQNLPFDKNKGIFRYADDVDIPTEMSHVAMVFPFSFDVAGKQAANTMQAAWAVYQQLKDDVTSDVVFSYNWIWAVGRLATLCFYEGWGNRGFEVLKKTPLTLRSFLAPNEHYNPEYGAFLPWFTSGAGAWIYGLHAMFVQIYDQSPPILFPAVPQTLQDANVKNLYVVRGVTLTATIRSGKPSEMSLHSPHAGSFSFRIPAAQARACKWSASVKIGRDDRRGLKTFQVRLKKGENELLLPPRKKRNRAALQ
jgi:hypothetical protein